MIPRLLPLAGLLALAVALPGQAQDDVAELREQLEQLESWIVIEEDQAPDPPVLRAHAALVGWLDVRTRFQLNGDGVPGTDLRNLEEGQGLPSGGVSPWVEVSLGAKVRGGIDATSFWRNGGELQVQDQDVVFAGEVLARRGELLRANLEFHSLGGFIEWDALYGKTYRMGLVGGIRYLRFDVDLRAVGPQGATQARKRGELLSPFFGGLAELTPFPYFSVFVRAQFMNWSWEQINLKEARFFEFRLGVTIHFIPGTLGAGVEFRFLNAEASAGSDDRINAGIAASGAAFTLTYSF